MCKDGVIPWIVLANPVEISYRQLIAYRTTLLDLPKPKISFTKNRPVQPLNNRTVQIGT
jgi:carbonic anhydrase